MAELRGCPRVLQSGNRRGQPCGRGCYIGEDCCRMHQGVDSRRESRQELSRVISNFQSRELAGFRNGEAQDTNAAMYYTMLRTIPNQVYMFSPSPVIQYIPETNQPYIRVYNEHNWPFEWRFNRFTSKWYYLAFNHQPSSVSSMKTDEIVGIMLDTGKSVMTSGECSICCNENADLICFPCHNTHTLCVTCLEANYKTKSNKLICPHCRFELKDANVIA